MLQCKNSINQKRESFFPGSRYWGDYGGTLALKMRVKKKKANSRGGILSPPALLIAIQVLHSWFYTP